MRMRREQTGCAIGTLKSRVHRARLQLRAYLTGEHPQDGGVETTLPAAEQEHPEQSRVILPDPLHLPPGTTRDLDQPVRRMFIAVFSMDRFRFPKPDAPATEMRRLIARGDQVHLDTAFTVIPDRLMPEATEIEIGSGLPIQAPAED